MSASRFSLFKRGGIYYVTYYDDQGHRRWKSTGERLKPGALKAFSQFKQLLFSKQGGVPFREFVYQFLAYSTSVHRPKTVSLFRKVPSINYLPS